MSMVPYNRDVGLEYRVLYMNGMPWSNVLQVLESQVLTGVISNPNGDKKTPNDHRYDRVVTRHPYGWTETLENWGDGYLWRDVGSFSGSYGTPEAPSSINSNMVYNKVLEKLYKAIRNSDLNLAVDLAERKDTIRMVANAVKGIRRFKYFALKALEHPTKTLSDAWLSYTYGWKPTLQTMYALAQHVLINGQYHQVKVRSGQKTLDRQIISGFPACNIMTSRSYREEIGITYSVNDPSLFEASRLSSLNPVLIGWELVPYSFVFDWIVDIGGYLQLVESSLASGLDFHEGYRTTTYLHNTVGVWSGPVLPASSYYPYSDSKVEYSVRRSGLNRTRLTSFPAPSRPTVRVDLGSSRILSAAALLRQRFR